MTWASDSRARWGDLLQTVQGELRVIVDVNFHRLQHPRRSCAREKRPVSQGTATSDQPRAAAGVSRGAPSPSSGSVGVGGGEGDLEVEQRRRSSARWSRPVSPAPVIPVKVACRDSMTRTRGQGVWRSGVCYILAELLADRPDLLAHRRREHHHLLLVRGRAEDLLNVLAHVWTSVVRSRLRSRKSGRRQVFR